MALELPAHHRSTGLVDVLDRVLDKGLVIAGDIKVSLAEVELLTIRIRLLVCSLDKAQEILFLMSLKGSNLVFIPMIQVHAEGDSICFPDLNTSSFPVRGKLERS